LSDNKSLKPATVSLKAPEPVALFKQFRKESNLELQGFSILAAGTGLQKTAILSPKLSEVQLGTDFPYMHLPKKDIKTRHSNRPLLPD